MEIAEIRRTQLRKLIDERFDGVTLRLAVALDMKPPQLHRWLSGGQGIHEESARKIEEKLKIQRGWLDSMPPMLQESAPAYRVDPAGTAAAVLTGLHTLLYLAGLPKNALGNADDITTALIGGSPPATYSLKAIHAATVEVVTECAESIAHLTPEQVAQLIADKLVSWIEAAPEAPAPLPPAGSPQGA